MITRRGGGVLLNFRITQYNEGTDLSRIIGKPNEIAVMTANKIKGWTISMEEPELPQTGDIWIKTTETTNISFDILKKNSLILNLMAVFQYETGEWKKREAAIYQDGSWHHFEIWLYNRGDQCTDTTGGWKSTNYYDAVSFYNDRINCSATAGDGYASVCTKNKVNLSGKTKLYCRAKYSYVEGRSYGFGLSTNNDQAGVTYVARTIFDTSAEKLYVLDVTSYKNRTDLYVSFTMQSGNAYEIWLE